jgi:hypothetical protein
MNDFQAVVRHVVNERCSTDSGYATRGIAEFVARQPGHESTRQHSALVGAALRLLADCGYIARLDDQKPTIWCKAPSAPEKVDA